MDTVTQIQIMDEAIFISHSANIIGKGINPTILPLAMGKLTTLFNFWMPTGLGEEELLIQTC